MAAEIKRKLEKKEKKRKKREKKLQEEANGEANGDAEVNIDIIIIPSGYACIIWDLTPTRGPVSVYDMRDQPDSEPLAGPKQWA